MFSAPCAGRRGAALSNRPCRQQPARSERETGVTGRTGSVSRRCSWLALLTLLVFAPALQAGHGVVLLYHHVSSDTPPVTSIAPDRFEAQLDYLVDHDFSVWPLQRLLDAILDDAETVPDRVVAISFDDAYRSVYAEAWPRLRARGWPFTVFVNTDAVDAGHRPYMSWDQLRDIAAAGVAIENHSASHAHLIARRDDESHTAWRARVSADLTRAHQRIAEEVGREPALFSYPYGEDSGALAALVGRHYAFAMTQRSGAIGPLADPLSLPRFPMASGFDDMKRFALAVHSRPLPVIDVETQPPGDGVRDPLDALVLTVRAGPYRAGQLACYSAAGQPLEIGHDNKRRLTVTIAIGGLGQTGRNKINCTAPAADGSGAYYWFAYQWVQDAVRD